MGPGGMPLRASSKRCQNNHKIFPMWADGGEMNEMVTGRERERENEREGKREREKKMSP